MEFPHHSRHGEDNDLVLDSSAISGFKDNLKLTNIHDLPYEVLTHVFRLYISEERGYYHYRPYWRHYRRQTTVGAFPLGAVCQTWRSVAWADHCLWNSLTFYMRQKTTEMHVQLATEWLGRSGKLPLCIIIYGSSELAARESLLYPLMDVIDQLLDRCHELGLCNLSSLTFSRLCDDHRSVTVLESLMITGRLDDPLDFSSAAPIDLSICGVDLTRLLLDWSALTLIEVHNMFVDEVVQIFSLAPQLESCQAEDVTNRQMEPQQGHKSIVCTELQEIQIFSLYADDDDVIGTILQAVTFPSLRICDIAYEHHFSTAIFLDFVSRSCCIITDLTLEHHGLSGEDLILIAQALPSIEHLCLGSSQSSPNGRSANPFFNALCLDLDSKYGNIHSTGGVLLPKLKRLTVSTCVAFPWEYLWDFRWRNLYSVDGTGTSEQRRPQLQSISIQCELDFDSPDEIPIYSDDDDASVYSDDDASDIFISDDLLFDWDTFSDLLELGTKIHLELEVETSRHQKTSLLSLMYRRLEENLGSAPDDIVAAVNDYERATKKKIV